MDYHRTMLSLYQRVNGRAAVVGWYSTGSGSGSAGENVNYLSALIHEVYREEVNNGNTAQQIQPVHLVVDVSLERPLLPVQAYTAQQITVDGKQLCARFEAAALEMHAYESEKIGVDALINGVPEGDELDAPAMMLGDIDNLEHAMIRLLDAIDTCNNYVERVAAGGEDVTTADVELGESIASALHAVPHIDPATFQQMFTTHLQDLLMLVYLANMTHTQVNVADKVGALIQ